MPNSKRVRFVLWPKSRIGRAMSMGGNALLEFVFEHVSYQVRLNVIAHRQQDATTLTVV
ncbi:hypothetical protein [Candidatus Vallotia cooleyia]|uniref:hypothetical protein n=1 Tax=Candidatus Vallotiella adelgis TaxID=1177211 RepID=UPI001D02803D|nr:hypothetical protein [Candidatus Vallotia cooleyia]